MMSLGAKGVISVVANIAPTDGEYDTPVSGRMLRGGFQASDYIWTAICEEFQRVSEDLCRLSLFSLYSG